MPRLPACMAGPKKQDRINARVAFIEGDMTELEQEAWNAKVTDSAAVTALTAQAKVRCLRCRTRQAEPLQPQ